MSNCCLSKESGPSPASAAVSSALPLAIATVPFQPWEEPCDPCKGLKTGTIFPGLDLPFYVTGGDGNG